ncbi:DUF4153 domain-containing protein [Massilia soli]|uniref:DUF4153 domain-containing protein n=1 Tax=Massilia soli TaxID=2792854 RepID=A0ABS7SSX3_9BURK|nr:DUF4153 domain-containing protein [Massilia soli]MBZ2209063.1 DUF4153 domain-containing protein [Massilia soli]
MLTSDMASNWPAQSLPSSNIGAIRVAAGLVQGLVLYLLYQSFKAKAWPSSEPLLAGPLVLVWLIVPILFIASIGALNRRQLLTWIPVAAAILGALGAYDVWRAAGPGAVASPSNDNPSNLTGQLIVVCISGFFIAQSLVMAGAGERRRIASYPAYFETAWKQFVQLSFSALFVGVTWLVLLLGSELFMLIKLDFLRQVIGESWFVIPMIALAFSCAMHITDVRPAIVRGIRTLLLVLLSWILPVAVLVIGGFLASLPFTGLEPLWATRSATAVLLGAAAVLVVLVNAAYQDGAPDVAAAPVVQGSVRVASVLLAPIVLIGLYALSLRVGDYGWTTSRIVAAACLAVASIYAAGYAWAALRPDRRIAISTTNITNAFVVLGMLLTLFSPLGDPARLSVASQVARLQSGKVAPDKFDFAYLRFEGKRHGHVALEQLRANFQGQDAQLVRDKIAAVQKMNGPVHQQADLLAQPVPVRLSENARVWPKGSRLPASFLTTNLNLLSGSPYPACLRGERGACDLVLLDLTGDGKPEIVMLGALPEPNAVVVSEVKPGQWRPLGTLPSSLAACASLRQALIDGKYTLAAPVMRELDIGDMRLAVRPHWEPELFTCPD